ncbi:MAG: HK97 gp10 family phage protein [Clostridiales bacterium]
MAEIGITGLEQLEKKLKLNCTMSDVKRVVRKNGSDMQQKIQSHADFTRGYATGTTKRSVDLKIEDGGMTASSGPDTEYSLYLEYGTRFMEAQPFIKPGYQEQKGKFKSDMQKLVK